MRAKLIFFAVAAAAAIGSAALAGLIVAVAGLSTHLPAATLITLIAGAGAATFAGVVALASMAASLFFSTPERPPPASTSATASLDRQKNPGSQAAPRNRHQKPTRRARGHPGQVRDHPVPPSTDQDDLDHEP